MSNIIPIACKNNKIEDINNIISNSHYDCIKIPIDSEFFKYDEKLMTLNENFVKLNEMNINFDYYSIYIKSNNNFNFQIQLFRDMNKHSTVKFNFSKKLINLPSFIDEYILFQKLLKIMTIDDYLKLDNSEILDKYENKYLIIHDKLPHIDNLNYINNLIGFEIDNVENIPDDYKNTLRRKIFNLN
jgi:hypothetical protein